MRLKDIPNLRLTTREKRLLAECINDHDYNGQEVVSLRNWQQLSAVKAVQTVEVAIENDDYNDEEMVSLIRIVMKVTEIVENE